MQNFLSNFSKYDGCLPAGLILPEVKIDEKYYDQLKISSSSTNFEFLGSLCHNAIAKMTFADEAEKTKYNERLQRELALFYELGFTDYVLIIWDILNFCHEKGIPVGLGRGSCSGSLVLFLINVTGIDPIKYNLYFERFVSKARAKQFVEGGVKYLAGSLAPDVDSDISYERRQEVIDYIYFKYPNFAASISTFATLSGKLCIKECSKIVEETSEEDAQHTADSIPKIFGKVMGLKKATKESEKFNKWAEKHGRVFNISKQLEGLIKNTSVHPSGIAIGNKKISELCPISFDDKGRPVAGYEMGTISELMIKVDILGLKTLSVIDDCCKRIGIDWKKIDVNDKAIYTSFQNIEYPKGIFQIEANATFEVCKKVKPSNIQELSDVIALSRPGAMAFVDDYVDIKNGNKVIPERQKVLDEILKETKGVLIYQESLMRIAHEVFGLSLEDAEMIRRACGKKKPKEMKKWESKIRSQGKELSIDKAVVDFYWAALIAAADYSFNKCLSPDSVVSTPIGDRLLYQISIGDKVFSYSPEDDRIITSKVSDKMTSSSELFEFELEDGRGVTCSMEHKFLCEDNKMRPIKDIISQSHKIKCID